MKRFYRSRKNKIVAGVAGGIAEYFDIDPIIARLLFLVLLFSGAMIIAYLVAWFLVPLAPEGE